MGKALSKNFHSIEIWANLFLLDNLVLMSSQDECHGKRSRQNSHRLEAFFYVFSAARWEVYKVQLNLYSLQPNMVKLYRFSSVQFSRSDMSNSLWPHESQHARPPCPSPCPGVHSDSRPLSPWCHTAISSSVVPFSSCPQSLPASESFPMSQLFAWGGQSTGASALASFLPKKSQGWSPSEWTGWISFSPRDSQESYPIPQFNSINYSVLSRLHSPTITSIHNHRKNHSLD